jgi:hypothetical protein
MTFQAVATLSNKESLCIGEITLREAELAQQSNPEFDGYGLYLVDVDNNSPSEPGRILAKFASEDAAAYLAKFFRMNGALVIA